MIDKIRLQNFKGHLDTEVPLGRLTMLVGDNASGKTSVLEALWLFTSLAGGTTAGFRGAYAPDDLLRRAAKGRLQLTPKVNNSYYELRIERAVPPSAIHGFSLQKDGYNLFSGFFEEDTSLPVGISRNWEFQPAQLLRLRADQIAASAYSDEQNVLVESDGTNTAVVLAAMKLADDEAFQRVEDGLRKLVPSVRRIRLRRANVERPARNGETIVGNKIFFDFNGAVDVPAHGASQGTLLALALLTVLHSANRPHLLLLDDFDHALHPRAQMELVRMLKGLLALPEFAKLQIVATTHSPYVLDCVDPGDVQVFATREDGIVASKRLSEHPQAKQTKGSLSAGQLWSLDPERDWVIGK